MHCLYLKSLKFETCKYNKTCLEYEDKMANLEKEKDSSDREMENLRACEEKLLSENEILTNDKCNLNSKLEFVGNLQLKLEDEVEKLRYLTPSPSIIITR